MAFISTVLACLMIGGGFGAVVFGSGMIVLERGWSMVISGSVIATGGVILLGIVQLIRETRRIPDLLTQHLYALSQAPAVAHWQEQPKQAATPFSQHEREKEDTQEESLPLFAGIGSNKSAEQEPLSASGRRPSLEIARELGLPGAFDTSAFDKAEPLSTENRSASALPAERPSDTSDKRDGETDKQPLADTSPTISAADPVSSLSSRPSVPPKNESVDKSADKRFGWLPFGKRAKKNAEPEQTGPTAADLARARLGLPGHKVRPEDIESLSGPDDDNALPEESKALEAPAVDTHPDELKAATKDETPEQTDSKAENEAPPVARAAEETTEARDNSHNSIEDDNTRDEDTGAVDSPEQTPERSIVGSYHAAGNLYIMYDDGTIESETPKGIFRFNSLDNLKAYIASGEDPDLAGERVERPHTATES